MGGGVEVGELEVGKRVTVEKKVSGQGARKSIQVGVKGELVVGGCAIADGRESRTSGGT